MNGRQTECVYCGARGKLTKDHIPPIGLFSKPRPPDLITVPSCRRCNNGASKDDEYFKAVLSLKEGAGDHPDAKGIRESVLRSLARPDSRGFSGTFLRQTGYRSVRTPAGLLLGKKLAYNVNLERLDRVAARIVKGLFYVLKGKRIPSQYAVAAQSEDTLRDVSESDLDELTRTIITPVQSGTHGIGANEVMKYWVGFDPMHEYISAWILEFYSDVRFLVLVVPNTQSQE